MSSFASKILSRLLNDRLAVFLPSLIYKEQTCFVRGRNIYENVALAHEMMADIELKTFGGKITLIKHVLSSIPIHTMSALPVPKACIDSIHNILASFFWSAI